MVEVANYLMYYSESINKQVAAADAKAKRCILSINLLCHKIGNCLGSREIKLAWFLQRTGLIYSVGLPPRNWRDAVVGKRFRLKKVDGIQKYQTSERLADLAISADKNRSA